MKRPESYCQKDQIYGSPIYSSCFFSFQYNTKVYDDIKKIVLGRGIEYADHDTIC